MTTDYIYGECVRVKLPGSMVFSMGPEPNHAIMRYVGRIDGQICLRDADGNRCLANPDDVESIDPFMED